MKTKKLLPIFKNGRFLHPWLIPKKSKLDFLKLLFTKKPKIPIQSEIENYYPTISPLNWEKINHPKKDKITATWV